LGEFVTAKALVKTIAEPSGLWERVPPVRFRKTVPTSWLELSICEGKNRQVRRMTAKVGLPTLRLVRAAIGGISLDDLQPGQWREMSYLDFIKKFNRS
jgi:23S rRNA pseudouridine2457 synthase